MKKRDLGVPKKSKAYFSSYITSLDALPQKEMKLKLDSTQMMFILLEKVLLHFRLQVKSTEKT